jgi:hypothetical protein
MEMLTVLLRGLTGGGTLSNEGLFVSCSGCFGADVAASFACVRGTPEATEGPVLIRFALSTDAGADKMGCGVLMPETRGGPPDSIGVVRVGGGGLAVAVDGCGFACEELVELDESFDFETLIGDDEVVGKAGAGGNTVDFEGELVRTAGD